MNAGNSICIGLIESKKEVPGLESLAKQVTKNYKEKELYK